MNKRRAAALASATLVLVLSPAASAYRYEGGRWPATTITYYNEVPAYSWAVDAAASAWTASGARVQFVKSSRATANVLIGVRWFKIAGDASLQRVNGRFVSAKVGIRGGQNRYTMALVVTHELGHVLGLDHEDRVCATMNAFLVNNSPEHCPAAPPGQRVCRLLRVDDVRGAVSLYGGSVQPIHGPQFCKR